MENVDKLNKKIAEWCGFRGRTTTDPDWYRPQVIAPGGQVIAMPDFTTALDACFEYIVPKLGLVFDHIQLLKRDKGWIARVRGFGYHYMASYYKTPAPALCRAVEKLIDGE